MKAVRIAVSGANGTIGSRLCADLERDYEVVRIDIRGPGKNVDVQDLAALTEALRGCETLIHLAWMGGASRTATWDDTQRNIAGTYNAFESARIAGCKRVIFASSNHVVGRYELLGAPGIWERKNGTLIGTAAPLRVSGLYGVWKALGEILGRYYSDEYGLQVACLRIGHIRKDDTPDLDRLTFRARESAAGTIGPEQARRREAAVYMSHRDLARLVRAVLVSDVRFGIAFGVGDNPTRFWDLEAGRALYGFWPLDGIK